MRRTLKTFTKATSAVLAMILVITIQSFLLPQKVNATEYNPNIVSFVTSLYSDCLGRTPDPIGLNDWCNRLSTGAISGKQCAYGFFYSKEYKSWANTASSVEMVTSFYKVFLNRTPDTAGLNYWLDRISNTTNDLSILFTGFADSNEFMSKCSSYGISSGRHIDVPDSVIFHPDEIFATLVSFMSTYPEGTPFTNNDYRPFNGGHYRGGYGCAGFSFMLSDAVFGTLPARIVYSMNNIRVGDIVRLANNTHSVIVLDVDSSGITVAEGNYNNTVHWGRYISFNDLSSNFTYVMTRYPQA